MNQRKPVPQRQRDPNAPQQRPVQDDPRRQQGQAPGRPDPRQMPRQEPDAFQSDPFNQSQVDFPGEDARLPHEEKAKDGMGLVTAAVVLVLALIVLIAVLVAMIITTQPKPRITTVDDLNAEATFAEVEDVPLPDETLNQPADGPRNVLLDRITIPSEVTAEVATPGIIEVNQIVGTERFPVCEVGNIFPNTEIVIEALDSNVVQNAGLEFRMKEPIVYVDGARGSFHAYYFDYAWERDSYIRSMPPSIHPLYVLAEGEQPDYLELIDSGIAEETSRNPVRHGGDEAEIQRLRQQEQEREANNANSNAKNENSNETGNGNNANDNGNTRRTT